MKYYSALASIALSGMGAFLSLGVTEVAEARTWSNQDQSKTFEGDFKDYNKEEKKVTIIKSNGHSIEFSIEMLSEADQKWVLEQKPDQESIEKLLQDQEVGNMVQEHLVLLEKKKFKKATLTIVPEYYLLYFSASW